MNDQNLETDNFEWVAGNSSFILYKDNNPTETKVLFDKGIWSIIDQGRRLYQYYFDTPSEAMTLVNRSHKIDAPYDEYGGLSLVVDGLKRDIDDNFESIDDSLSRTRNDLYQLKSVYIDDDLFSEVSGIIDDYLSGMFRMNRDLRKRLDDLISKSEDCRKNNR